MEGEPRYVGIDVSMAQVDVAVRPTGQIWATPYNETGVGELNSSQGEMRRWWGSNDRVGSFSKYGGERFTGATQLFIIVL